VYEFGPYDQLTDALAKRGIRALYILDYSNKLYESDQSVRTEEGRRAFARFAAAAARRYRAHGILWELWNEPNISFWKPQPNVNDYMALAKAVFPAIREADPDALCVAPATAGIAFSFLEDCFKQGLLHMVDAVTIHPYRQSPPETVAADILKLRALIARYRPDRPHFPILSGEWGYSAVWKDFDEQRQGQYLPRQFLTNLSLGIPLSIWYDWHDDGKDPKNAEHHFGTVTHDYKPKPAYLAMQRLVPALAGMHFVKRLQSAPEDYLLLFSDGRRYAIAAWTTGEEHEIEPFSGQRLRLSGDPQYTPVPRDASHLLAEGAWTVEVRSVGVRGGAAAGAPLSPQLEVCVRNPFLQRIEVNLDATATKGLDWEFIGPRHFELLPMQERRIHWAGKTARRSGEELSVTVDAEIAGYHSQQRVTFLVVNPIIVGVVPSRNNRLAAVLRNPTGERFEGALVAQTGPYSTPLLVKLEADMQKSVVRPMPSASARGASASGGGAQPVKFMAEGDTMYIELPVEARSLKEPIRVSLNEGEKVVAESEAVRFAPLNVNTETARAFNDGDAKVPAEFELTEARYGAQEWFFADHGLRFTYDYGKGWKFVRIAPPQRLAVEGKPHAIGVWVRGDGSDCGLNMRFVDQNKRTFQSSFGRLNFKGWRFLTAEMDNPNVGHWGGEGDPSHIAYPIQIDTFILVDGKREPVKGNVEFASFHLIYRE
jgi:hypothetical protein